MVDAEDVLRDRISTLIRDAGGAKLLAERTGIPLGTLNKYLAKTSMASFGNVVRLAEAVGADLAEIAGQSSKFGTDLAAVGALPEEQGELVRLPQFEVRASAGRGLIAVDQMPVGEVAFGRDFLRNLGANPEYCYILEARGDSMWPTIPDGALLIADASKTQVDDGRIYHFNVMDKVLVKRARWSMDGKLYLTSDNQAAGYPPEVFAADRVHELNVGGRIMFTGHAPLPVR
jgi:phage repressor protein C with HTH and peptisase S24 domain